jgi:hypothetical protein
MSTVKRAFLAVLFLLVAVRGGIVQADNRLLIPDEWPIPLYVVGAGHTDDGWVAAVCYRSLNDAPGDLTVNGFCDETIQQAYPLRVEGFAVRREDAAAPINYWLWNVPSEVVEVCLFRVEDQLAALFDEDSPGVVTIDELRAMPSLLVGLADSYAEMGHPFAVPGYDYHKTVKASGVLKDGRTFTLDALHTIAVYSVVVEIGD